VINDHLDKYCILLVLTLCTPLLPLRYCKLPIIRYMLAQVFENCQVTEWSQVSRHRRQTVTDQVPVKFSDELEEAVCRRYREIPA
jgi:hypothetical protein